jgi:hypothetical protein
MMRYSMCYVLLTCSTLLSCGQSSTPKSKIETESRIHQLVEEEGKTVKDRFNTPKGYERISVDSNSFANYLRNLPLKPVGEPVKYFDGTIKEQGVYEAVVAMDISQRDLQQCADAIMRLRGEYFYARQQYDLISFTLTNGFKMDYSMWIQGNRVEVQGNKTSWRKTKAPSNTYQDFRNYMEFVFMYAGTLSLAKTLKSKRISELAIGDVFIVGGSPGHAVIVVDVAMNVKGQKVFMLAQSYMPAQETQILKNLNDPTISPWYQLNDEDNYLYTPEWTFDLTQLKTW